MLHVKKDKIDLSRKIVKNPAKAQIQIYIYLSVQRSLPKSDFEQKNIPYFKVGSFRNDTTIFNLLLDEEYKSLNPITLLLK